jgi:hypothetical protein
MLSPTSSFKMSKAGKIVLANAWNRAGRGQLRRSIIQGELAAKVQVRTKRDN